MFGFFCTYHLFPFSVLLKVYALRSRFPSHPNSLKVLRLQKGRVVKAVQQADLSQQHWLQLGVWSRVGGAKDLAEAQSVSNPGLICFSVKICTAHWEPQPAKEAGSPGGVASFLESGKYGHCPISL
jgi:hypothetical protein